jgi:hypothetical protein
LRPGIKQNGISNTRVSYPFYKAYSTTVTLTKGEVTVVNPTTRYYNYTKIAYNEYFENNVVQLEQITSGKGVSIVRTSLLSNDIYGIGDSGEIFLSGKDSFFDIKTKASFPLPVGGRDVYLELNYKTPIAFDFGILSNSTLGTTRTLIYTFNPTYDKNGVLVWNKIYIGMAPEVGSNANAIDYQLYFSGGQKSTDVAAHIFLDNIKIAHVKQ